MFAGERVTYRHNVFLAATSGQKARSMTERRHWGGLIVSVWSLSSHTAVNCDE